MAKCIVKYDVDYGDTFTTGKFAKYAPGVLLHADRPSAERECKNALKAGYPAQVREVLVRVH